MTTEAALATIADLERQPGRCELIHGAIVTMSPAGFDHGFVVANVATALRNFLSNRNLGKVLAGDPGFIIDGHNVRAPDVAYVTAESAAAAPRKGFMHVLPMIAVEVVSPGDAYGEVVEKARMWIDHGVALVWVVDPRSKTVEVYAEEKPVTQLDEGDTVDGGKIRPGFTVPVADLFV